jgi:hypothetical protein
MFWSFDFRSSDHQKKLSTFWPFEVLIFDVPTPSQEKSSDFFRKENPIAIKLNLIKQIIKLKNSQKVVTNLEKKSFVIWNTILISFLFDLSKAHQTSWNEIQLILWVFQIKYFMKKLNFELVLNNYLRRVTMRNIEKNDDNYCLKIYYQLNLKSVMIKHSFYKDA